MKGLSFGALAIALVATTIRSAQESRGPVGAAQDVEQAQGLESLGREVWGVEFFERQELALPEGAPTRFDVLLERGGRPVRLSLGKYSVRAPGAILRVQGEGGAWREAAMPSVSTYRGSAAGVPGATVLASLGRDGLIADVIVEGEVRWCVRPMAALDGRVQRASHAVFDGPEEGWGEAPCGVLESVQAVPLFDRLAQPLMEPPNACQKLCEIAFDADFEYYQAKGSSVAATVQAIDAIMNQVDFYYARDVAITYQITGYVVRSAPFYAPVSGGDLLDLFETEWVANQTAIQRDVTHLMTGKPVSVIQHGGLAQLGVVCVPGYAWSMDGANIVGHELGHNWGASHCHDPSPCNNMCGACLNVAPVTKGIIEAFRDSASCLDDVGPYATAVPPYASPDSITLRKEELDSLGSLTFDVLANDEDGNCDPLFLASFDPVASRGGSVSLSPGSGPQGRDQLIYTPSQTFVGEESFHYRVGDGLLTTEGTVTIGVPPIRLIANWRLDEGAGTEVSDESLAERAGTLVGDPAWILGQFGSALDFDGVDDTVLLPALDLADDSVTISTWFRRDGSQNNFAGLVFSRDGSTAAGLQLMSNGSLAATWNRVAWSPSMPTPNGQWVFAAMVVEPEALTLHLYDGSLTTLSQSVSNTSEAFNGELRFAHDDYFTGSRRFDGALDEVRVYDYALDPGEILDLAVNGGAVAVSGPRDGGVAASPTEALTWVASPLATGFDVYFGTDYLAVRDATLSSPEYLGSSIVETFAAPPFAPGVEYFWRVDQDLGGQLQTGPVWQFELVDYHHWKLDETSGNTANAAVGGIGGTYVGGTLGQPGASPSLGTSVDFDGRTERVEIGALGLDSNGVTFTAWVRRDGNQSYLAGILGARDTETISGLHVDGGNELRYHWNDDGATWGWSSGLTLPDGAWVFVALVIEPERGTLYMGKDGLLDSATNGALHPAEPFGGLLYLAHDPIDATVRRHFKGGLDDVRVYGGPLSPAQVDALYQSSR